MSPVNRKYPSYYSFHINDHYSVFFFFVHEMIFVILYPAIDFKTSRIPTVKNYVSRSREDDFIPLLIIFVSRIPPGFSVPSRIPPNLCWTLQKGKKKQRQAFTDSQCGFCGCVALLEPSNYSFALTDMSFRDLPLL